MKKINLLKYLLIAGFYFFKITYTYSQSVNKQFVNSIINDTKNNFSDYAIIDIEDELKKQEIAVSTDFIRLYYFNSYTKTKKSEKKYLKYLKQLLKKNKAITEHSSRIEVLFKDNLIDDTEYKSLKKENIEVIIKTYFNTDYTINYNYNKKTLNTVIKLLYDKEVLVTQEDISGVYYLDNKPWIKQILQP